MPATFATSTIRGSMDLPSWKSGSRMLRRRPEIAARPVARRSSAIRRDPRHRFCDSAARIRGPFRATFSGLPVVQGPACDSSSSLSPPSWLSRPCSRAHPRTLAGPMLTAATRTAKRATTIATHRGEPLRTDETTVTSLMAKRAAATPGAAVRTWCASLAERVAGILRSCRRRGTA